MLVEISYAKVMMQISTVPWSWEHKQILQITHIVGHVSSTDYTHCGERWNELSYLPEMASEDSIIIFDNNDAINARL